MTGKRVLHLVQSKLEPKLLKRGEAFTCFGPCQYCDIEKEKRKKFRSLETIQGFPFSWNIYYKEKKKRDFGCFFFSQHVVMLINKGEEEVSILFCYGGIRLNVNMGDCQGIA